MVALLFIPAISGQPEERFVSIDQEGDRVFFSHEGTTWFSMALGDVSWKQDGNQWKGESRVGVLTITDSAKAHVSFRGIDPEVDFGDAQLTRHDKGILVEKDGQTAFAREESHRRYFFSFQIRGDAPDERDRAVENRKVAAHVRDRDVEAYEDIRIAVEKPERATPETPYRVVFDANFTEGRTIVLDVEPRLISGVMQLRYFDINDDGTETEVVFRQASSLEDVLEPTDDAGQPEYWVVRDTDGLQVMVSVPNWSAHAVTLAGFGEVVQPTVLIGLVAGVGVTICAAVALFRPRQAP